MRIKLSFLERFGMIHILSVVKHASLKDWKGINQMKKILAFTPKEIKSYNIRPREDGKPGVAYDTAKVNQLVEFTLPDTGFAWLKQFITNVNDQGALAEDLIPVAEKVMSYGETPEKRTKVSKAPPLKKGKAKKAIP